MKLVTLLTIVTSLLGCTTAPISGTGDLGVVIERANGSVQIINHTTHQPLANVSGLGDLSHASVVFSRDQKFAYVFGRDGGLTQIDILQKQIKKRIIQGGNSIGGAISQDGKIIAVSNYEPGGVKLFDTKTLELIADIPAEYQPSTFSKVVGLVDAPGNLFVFSLYDADQIWIANAQDPDNIKLTKFENIGKSPYDALITPDGRYYIAGLFGEDGMALLDLWHPASGPRKVLHGYGKGNEKRPVYKMPHLEGWAIAGNKAFFPAVGEHAVLVMDMTNWQLIEKIPVHSQPVFVMSQPDNRNIWVNFAFPDNNTVQIINTESLNIVKTLIPGSGVLHMEFTPKGEQAWLSVRDENQVQVFETQQFRKIDHFPSQAPSGIFFTHRAHQIGL